MQSGASSVTRRRLLLSGRTYFNARASAIFAIPKEKFVNKAKSVRRAMYFCFLLCLVVSQLAMGQAAPTENTNSDVISMTKAGIGEQTIILAIQRGADKFDTSPQALIALKSAGVSDQVLNAVLASANTKVQASPEAQSAAAQALFKKALNAIGPHDKIAEIYSLRSKGSVIQSAQGSTRSFEAETVRVYPASVYKSAKASQNPVLREVRLS
jgi:hypothetical protein